MFFLLTAVQKLYKNSSGDEIANVNFFYDHIVQYFKISSVVEYSTRRRSWHHEWVWPRGISAPLQPRPYLL